jgi:hypothetical protein
LRIIIGRSILRLNQNRIDSSKSVSIEVVPSQVGGWVVSGVHRSGRGSVTRDPRLSLHAQVSNIRFKDRRLDQTAMTGIKSSGIAQLNIVT